MRITAGKFRNRRILIPKTGLRPTTDFIRQAVFNILGKVESLSFLDLCAGSGAVGLDALSRGAGELVFVEKNLRAVRAIKENLESLGVTGQVWHESAHAFISRWEGTGFDIIYFDPPYDKQEVVSLTIQAGIAGLVKKSLILETRRENESPAIEGLRVFRETIYGDSKLIFYQPKA